MTEKVNSEKEFRFVECEIEYDFKKGTKTYRRKDTWDVHKTEPVTEEERQEELELEKEREKEKEVQSEDPKGKTKVKASK